MSPYIALGTRSYCNSSQFKILGNCQPSYLSPNPKFCPKARNQRPLFLDISKFILVSEAWGNKTKKNIYYYRGTLWFLLFYFLKPHSQVRIFIYQNIGLLVLVWWVDSSIIVYWSQDTFGRLSLSTSPSGVTIQIKPPSSTPTIKSIGKKIKKKKKKKKTALKPHTSTEEKSAFTIFCVSK